uniref:Uncharacterized protein ORF Bo3 n=1 Tax=Bovine herpesvirus 4 TaxID=10385 RepID=G1EUP0_BHV4|nr:hypothetical protein [Bovine gammaherpesvirus 4]WIV69363.1 hypothetical protein pBo3 [Bovine gammaherpesvirus 4]
MGFNPVMLYFHPCNCTPTSLKHGLYIKIYKISYLTRATFLVRNVHIGPPKRDTRPPGGPGPPSLSILVQRLALKK